MLDFLPKGRFSSSMSSRYSPLKDIFWDRLGGCLEAVDSGTTTVVDNANMNYSPEYSSSALSATVAWGIRSFFCCCPTPRVTSWSPFEMATSLMPDWFHAQLAELAEKQPFGDGRVSLGFAFEGSFLPKDVVIGNFEKVRRLGIKLITSHYTRNPVFDAPPEYPVQLAAANGHISSTPEVELQMGIGTPVCFRPDLHEIASLGVDCHSSNSGDILIPRDIGSHTVEAAYNLGTIKGARAVGMGGEIGSIAVGKLADLIIFDAKSPGMVYAAQHNPVAAIVLHASVRDIDTVIVDVDGRKTGGKLIAVEKEVAVELLKCRQRLDEELSKLDLHGPKKAITARLHIDKDRIVDSLA
ncbi:hypothetical protein DFH08DRAFT_918078 [Mycena albidolilacea]|uniref:Amidohydrolase-related domain-containing protein n=1 Tax=Mycena albidolilacea TaxID=1033008 RepID=A0AAD7ED20_9AGAR|nr:hypothetical protein DFH08DRAFT_918078 [Mycena albidolilacea]